MLVDVILPLGPPKALSYEIPSTWTQRIRKGMCVQAPLRKQVHIGIVWRCPGAPYKGVVEPLIAVLEEKPLFAAESLRFLEWLSSYYLVPLGEVLKHSLPTKLQQGRGFSMAIPQATPLPSALKEPLSLPLTDLWALLATKKPVLWTASADKFTHTVLAPFITKALREKQSVLYLVPDARRIPFIREELQAEAGLEAYAFHAQQTPHAQAHTWRMVAQGDPMLLMGSKSAVLLPFQRLGLVIIEEEHHPAYKEDKRSFGYHARDSALMLAHQHQAACLMMSPCPSLESLHNLRQKKYQSFRTVLSSAAPIYLLSLQEEKRKHRLLGSMSRSLHEAISYHLAEKNPVFVFHPRKGYAPSLYCEKCSVLWCCSVCGWPCRYYRAKAQPCVRCGQANHPPPSCPACQGPWTTHKAGTESVEEVLQEHFPSARIAAWDAKIKPPARGSLKAFFQKENIAMLVGTPRYLYGWERTEEGMMILWDAHLWLQAPNFRSQEHLFQWAQSLRHRFAHMPPWIQTQYSLELPFFDLLTQADYKGFVEQEMKERKAFGYPPYTRLLGLSFRHKDPQVLEAAVQAHLSLLEQAMPNISRLGPEEMTKRADRYSEQRIIYKLPKKGNTYTLGKKKCKDVYQSLKKESRFQALWCIFEVDV